MNPSSTKVNGHESAALEADDLPQRSRWQLIASSVLLALWLAFLAWLALTA